MHSPNPNTDTQGENALESLELDHEMDRSDMDYEDLVYVPIYSDIYVDPQNPNNLLSATLSIRNTSYTDSLFISKIDYFNTEGELVRSFIDNPISLLPMATLNYVIEKDDDTGGQGANFMVALSGKNKDVKPVIQAIMIGQFTNKSFTLAIDGYFVSTISHLTYSDIGLHLLLLLIFHQNIIYDDQENIVSLLISRFSFHDFMYTRRKSHVHWPTQHRNYRCTYR